MGDDENPKHEDPAVQALIDNGWLGTWDYPITVEDLVNAVRLVREADEKELADGQDQGVHPRQQRLRQECAQGDAPLTAGLAQRYRN